MARLGDIATYVNGFAFKPTDWSNTGLPIIRIQDLTGNSYQANRYNGKYDSKYEVLDGDVLISWSASLGVYVWRGETALLNQHIFKVVFDKVDVDKNFFIHQVKAILEKASYAAHGATMKHLTKPVFDALPFYLPSIEEQKGIAERLDKICTLIEQREQQLSKLDELVKSRFVELFGEPMENPHNYPVKRIDEVAELVKGITY
ncbi:MAG: restriction endonuclease subunit S, partial [Clostridia bacterium]|nr:restriction endonuclease subunit S [Clostridia bacterium]